MVELNRVDEAGPHTYKIYGKHHLPHKGEHKLVATVKMNFRENSLTDCQNLPVLFMNAQVYRDENMRLRHQVEKQAAEIERLREALTQIARLRTDLRGDFSLGSKQSDIARAALGETA
jgi:hypothetical protein